MIIWAICPVVRHESTGKSGLAQQTAGCHTDCFFNAIRFRVKYYWPKKWVIGRQAIGYPGAIVAGFKLLGKEGKSCVATERKIRATACRHPKRIACG